MNWLIKEHKLKSILIFLLIAVSLIAAVHTVMYISVKNIIEDQIGLRAQTVATSVSHYIMDNIGEYKMFLDIRNNKLEYYRKMQQYFNNIKTDSNIKFIYTERRIDESAVEFILDSEEIGSADYSPPGSTTPNDWMRETVYEHQVPARFKAVNYPQWGNLIVAYAPIVDPKGALLGLVGANIASGELFRRLHKLNMIMISLYLTMLLFVVLILTKSSGFFLEKLLNDKLTGAINKRYFDTIMKKEMIRAVREKSNLVLFVLDLDHFKNINDTYGHPFGDQVLAAIAATIKKFLRQNDYFIRYGGEEFVMILPKLSFDNARSVAERIRVAVENTSIFHEEKGINVTITISIGIASLSDYSFDAKKLLSNADKALYDAKVNRNSVSIFHG